MLHFITKIHQNSSPKFQTEILLSMKSDEITVSTKKDPLILQLGMLQFEKYGNNQCNLIRQNMRMLARLILHINATCKEDKTAHYKT